MDNNIPCIVQLDAQFEQQVRALARTVSFPARMSWTKTPEAMMADELLTNERKAIAIIGLDNTIISYLDYKIKRCGIIGIGFCLTIEGYQRKGLMSMLFAYLIENYPHRDMTVGTSESNIAMVKILERHGFELVGTVKDRVNGEGSLSYRRYVATQDAAYEELIPKESGVDWVRLFPTSTSIEDLIPSFRNKVGHFIDSLKKAGADLRINATYRPPERAYLMHNAYRIAYEDGDPASIRPFWNLPIQWLHLDEHGNADREASVRAAKEMVRAYGIVYRPLLYSRHTEGRAIDMKITWNSDLVIQDGLNNTILISSEPRHGAGNTDLQTIGASFGVIKLVEDAPHWSDDGQ